jgi:transposase-like protein
MNINTEDLIRLYVEEKKSLLTIAKELGTNHTYIRRALKRAGVVTRRPGRQVIPEEERRTTKPCCVCKQIKTLAEFYPNRASCDGYGNTCRICDGPRRDKDRLKRLYNTTPLFIEQLTEFQNFRCALCGSDKTYETGRENYKFHIDHDHVTGTVRGLLCGNCNTGLGSLGDSVETLEHAIAYLRNTPAQQLRQRQETRNK